jgi:hypothetical protein
VEVAILEVVPEVAEVVLEVDAADPEVTPEADVVGHAATLGVAVVLEATAVTAVQEAGPEVTAATVDQEVTLKLEASPPNRWTSPKLLHPRLLLPQSQKFR